MLRFRLGFVIYAHFNEIIKYSQSSSPLSPKESCRTVVQNTRMILNKPNLGL